MVAQLTARMHAVMDRGEEEEESHSKALFEILYNLLTAPQTVSNMHVQVAQVQSCTNHVQHIQRLSRATCRVMCHVVRRDSSAVKFDRVEIAFI